MAGRVQVLGPPRAISWEPGTDAGDGGLRFGGWAWRYDLAPAGRPGTRVVPVLGALAEVAATITLLVAAITR